MNIKMRTTSSIQNPILGWKNSWYHFYISASETPFLLFPFTPVYREAPKEVQISQDSAQSFLITVLCMGLKSHSLQSLGEHVTKTGLHRHNIWALFLSFILWGGAAIIFMC